MNRQERIQSLKTALKNRILVLDGAMGTAIQQLNLDADAFGGDALDGCNENLVLTRPDIICQIHEDYLKAGADIVETNTFGATPLVLAEYDLSEKTYEINYQAAQIARKSADAYSTSSKPRFVAGAIGPTTKAISVTGGITFDELIEHFYQQALPLHKGAVDFFLIETSQDTRNVKAALLAIDRLFSEGFEKLPIAISGTIEPMGTMLAGQSVEALLTSIENWDLLYIGLNCATGPEFMTDHIRSLSKLSAFPIACVPNAGLPDEDGRYLETPRMVADIIGRFIQEGWINLVGGCCGTTPEHISALSQLAEGKKPRILDSQNRSTLSGIEYLEITDDLRPVLVGERTNVIGSRKFKRLICEEKFDEASEIAKAQVKNGAQIIDICLANPDRDEFQDMKKFLEATIQKIKAPLMIDSTDEKVIEMALTYSQGKAIINSINLEDGEERFEKVVPTARKMGAALVVGTIDDDPVQGMGVKRERKLAIAQRSFDLLTQKYGLKAEDIYWDPLVFPCGTGDAQYIGSAIETIEGVRLLKKHFPQTKTVLGISNVSFGLPEAGREVLNSVFLYHCVQAGLDLAIVNSEKLQRYASIPQEEIALSEDLLFNRGEDPVATFTAHFREKKANPTQKKENLTLDERLANYVLEGSKDGLIDDLNEALQTRKPLEIINGPLMNGMDEVGRLFNANQLIVAEVLQSAEAMKAAVAHLEPFMEKNTSTTRGKILLATVKGDVHDIGKNLVEIILSNNGFNIINLGIKVPPEQLIQAIREHDPDIVGLSGLLVKSAQQMVVTADDFSKAGISTPIMVGGAALTETFVDRKISPAYPQGTVTYAKDAMSGLDLAKTIMQPELFEELKVALQARREKLQESLKNTSSTVVNITVPQTRSKTLSRVNTLPPVPDFDRHLISNTPIEQIWKYINPLMLYGRHLGIKGGIVRLLERISTDRTAKQAALEQDPKSVGIWEEVQRIKHEYKATPYMKPSAVYRFFGAESEGNKIHIFDNLESSRRMATFDFPRQSKENGLCLADYIDPEKRDHLAFFAVSVGKNLRAHVEDLKNRGEYLKSHVLQALALESAEAYAEMLHAQIRKAWGFPDSPEMTMMERFQAKYTGKRYSFGYPACPRLDDQALLFDLLKPQDIGIELTEGFMMDPEASVSAIVFHHPEATYYSVGKAGELADVNR